SRPAFQERILSGVLGVFPVSEDKKERADQLVAQGVEGADEDVAGVEGTIGAARGRRVLVDVGHATTGKDEKGPRRAWRRLPKNGHEGSVPSLGSKYIESARSAIGFGGQKFACAFPPSDLLSRQAS